MTRTLRPNLIRALLLCIACAAGSSGQIAAPAADRAQTMRWFQSARFGMFIHWSISSVAGLEASWSIMLPGAMPKLGNITDAEYRAYAGKFKPDRFDPYAWIRLAKAAGQRYMVFVTKHHDGYCFFDSAYTKYKVTNGPYGKDIVKELAEACRREGMPLGFYYSPPDLDHPGYRDTKRPAKDNYYGEPYRPEWPLYLAYMELQLGELLSRYGQVPVLWFDGFKETPYSPDRFVSLVRRMQPGTLINNRLGAHGDFDISENVFPRRIPTRSRPIVQGTPSRVVKADISAEVPSLKEFRPWETCLPINETWSYNPNDKNFKTAPELIRTLVEIASRGGNFLLNVGPKPDGTIQPEVEQILLAIGLWIKTNGSAIYDTVYGPIQGQSAVRSTARGDRVFIHVFDWPQQGVLEIPALPHTPVQARLLKDGRPLKFRQQAGKLLIEVPRTAPETTVSVIEMKLARPVYGGGGK
jgi:alpha-L-fucosidase